MSLPASQVLLDDVEAAVRNGATTIAEVIARTGRGRRQVSESLAILVELEELFTARRCSDTRVWVFAASQDAADRLARHAATSPADLAAAHIDGPVAEEFIATRRRRWTAQLERLGVQRWRAHQLAASLRASADWRALLHELGGAVAVAGSLAASAVALFLL